MEPSTALKGRLFDLKQRFVRTMPDRITAMPSTLARPYHTLGGTAGTYALHAVAAATFLVDQLRVALAADAPAQWTARTVLTPADARAAAFEQTGVFDA